MRAMAERAEYTSSEVAYAYRRGLVRAYGNVALVFGVVALVLLIALAGMAR